jgi:hypothetical protein
MLKFNINMHQHVGMHQKLPYQDLPWPTILLLFWLSPTQHLWWASSFVLSQKRQFFRRIFWRKYLKNHNVGPWSPCLIEFFIEWLRTEHKRRVPSVLVYLRSDRGCQMVWF